MTGRNRKNSLKALFEESSLPAPETKSVPESANHEAPGAQDTLPHTQTPPRATSGAVKAMGLSLSLLAREAEDARALRQAIETGEQVISIDTARIDTSFISDRLSDGDDNDPDFLALVESMRESGQQVPILVRPHPEDVERYQVAYGHRRLKAARILGQPIKAIVRALTDSELVLAQGKENAERRNLSFIERAFFARSLIEAGFDRKIVGDALAVQKSELSRLLQVADAVPFFIVRAIGPAPKAGRERWMALSQIVGGGPANYKIQEEIGSEPFKSTSTDERFNRLYKRLAARTPFEKKKPLELKAPDGRCFARINRQGRGVRIEFLPDADPAFVEQATKRLEEDYARFLQGVK